MFCLARKCLDYPGSDCPKYRHVRLPDGGLVGLYSIYCNIIQFNLLSVLCVSNLLVYIRFNLFLDDKHNGTEGNYGIKSHGSSTTKITRNSPGDEIANVNFLYDDIVHALKI